MSSVRVWLGRRAAVGLVAAVLVVVLSGLSAAGQDPTGTAYLHEARSGHTATLLADETVLVAGGSDGESELASVEIVDPAGPSVSTSGPLVAARTDHTATLLSDGRILIAGGRADGVELAVAELLDPDSGLSEATGPLKWARADHDALLLGDGRVMLIGGLADGKPVARGEIFDPAKGRFKPAAKTKATHLDPAASVLPFGKVLLTGTATKKKGKPAEVYDPAKSKWSVLKKGPKLSGHTSTLLRSGEVLLVGGSSDEALLFDLVTNKFSPAGSLSASRSGHTATRLLFGEVLIVGGEDGGSEVPEIELFDIETNTNGVIGELWIPRVGHTTTALDDGGALVAGGSFTGLALDDLLYLDPDAYEFEPLGGEAEATPSVPEARTKSEVQTDLGPPDAFVTLYPDKTDETTTEPVSLQTWSYLGDGLELTFEGDELVAEDAVEPQADVLAAPYDPDLFSAYMNLDEVLAAAGVEDYFGGPMDDAETTELYFAQQLAWGLKDGELRFIEGIALGVEAESAEAGS